ncbi:O-antigen ligase family protein [Methylophilaceae bacterium Uisw_097]
MMILKKDNPVFHVPLEWIVAFALTVPTYIVFFIGKEPFMQGLAFTLYLIPIAIVLVRNGIPRLSVKFWVTWLLFCALWVIPSIINSMSPRLESDLVSLPILFYHVAIMTAIAIFFKAYCDKTKSVNQDLLLRSIFWVLVPMVVLIFFKTIYLDFQSDSYGIYEVKRPAPFGVQPNVNAEIIFTFLLVSLRLPGNFIKIIAVVIAVATCYLLESRGGLISCYIALIVTYCLPWILSKINWKVSILFLGSCLLISFLFFNEIVSFAESFLMLDDRIKNIAEGDRVKDFAGRLQMWQLGMNSIVENPFQGIGFWVNPMGYSIPENFPSWARLDHPGLVIHNAFIRIATENGLLLLMMVLIIIFLVCSRLIRLKKFMDLALVVSILFFLFFATRHLTLNLMNLLLYYTLIRSLSIDKKLIKI